MTTLTESVNGIIQGHALLLVCSVLYLAWWSLFFRPDAQVTGWPRTAGIACIVVAALCGVGGLVAAGRALPALYGSDRHQVPLWAFVLLGVAAYVLLLAITSGPLQRQVTSELLLIVLWATFEACVIASLASSGTLSPVWILVLAVVVAGFFLSALVCYVLYYRLPPMPAFIDGMVPLILVGTEAFLTIVILLIH